MPHPHIDVDLLLGFINDPKALSQAEQLQIAQHLTSGCTTCWSAVDQLPSIEPFRPSDVALREAFIHLSCPESRAVLASDHILTLERARTPPPGFALLLLAEGLNITLSQSEDAGNRDPVVLRLVESLLSETKRPLSRKLYDLSAQNQIHQTLVLLQTGRLKEAGEALMSAAALATRGTPDPLVFVNLCEAQARWAWNHDDLDVAVTCYLQATEFFDPGTGPNPRTDPVRRFEIHGEIAILHGLLGNPTALSTAEKAARQALSHLRRGGDPILATGAVLRDAELTKRLVMLVPHEHELRKLGVPQAAAALIAAADDFDRFTDPLTRAQKDFCLARLHIYFDPSTARTHYRQAIDGFRECQADHRSSSIKMEALLTSILTDTADGQSFTRRDFARLNSLLSQTSAWLSLDKNGKPN